MRGILIAIVWVLGIYFALYLAGTLVMAGAGALVTRRQRHQLLPSTLRRLMRAELAPPISVCVPAYNESAGVVGQPVAPGTGLAPPGVVN